MENTSLRNGSRPWELYTLINILTFKCQDRTAYRSSEHMEELVQIVFFRTLLAWQK